MTPHLVIDVRAARPQRDGLGTYIRELVPRLVAAGQFRTTLIVHPDMVDHWYAAAPDAAIQQSACRPMWVRQHWEIPSLVDTLRPDLFFYPAHDPPLLLRVPYVFTIHDLTTLTVRPYFERHDALKRGYIRAVVARGIRSARAVLAVSNATRDAIGEVFGDAAREKTTVTLNGTSPLPQHRPERHTRDPAFLYIGTDRPHKNVPRLLEAYAIAARAHPTLPRLEVVGHSRDSSELRARIRDLGLGDRVTFRGPVDDTQLEQAYADALAVVIPSLAEGFGMPIVDAMARGVPVVTSRGSGCAEVAGDVAVLVDPWRIDDIARGLTTIAADAALRHTLAARGPARAAEFTWDRSAHGTLDVLQRAVRRARR